jgi:phage tail-like protein
MPDRHGPLRTGRFKVEIDDVEVPGWQTVTIPGNSTETTTAREEEDTDHQRSLWGRTNYDDLEMERQMTDTTVYDWREKITQGKVKEGRKNVRVTLQNEEGVDKIRWEFTNAWIKEYQPPELDAGTERDVAKESVTVVFDEMLRETLGES